MHTRIVFRSRWIVMVLLFTGIFVLSNVYAQDDVIVIPSLANEYILQVPGGSGGDSFVNGIQATDVSSSNTAVSETTDPAIVTDPVSRQTDHQVFRWQQIWNRRDPSPTTWSPGKVTYQLFASTYGDGNEQLEWLQFTSDHGTCTIDTIDKTKAVCDLGTNLAGDVEITVDFSLRFPLGAGALSYYADYDNGDSRSANLLFANGKLTDSFVWGSRYYRVAGASTFDVMNTRQMIVDEFPANSNSRYTSVVPTDIGQCSIISDHEWVCNFGTNLSVEEVTYETTISHDTGLKWVRVKNEWADRIVPAEESHLSLIIADVDAIPVALNDTYEVILGTPLEVSSEDGVLHNDTDEDENSTLVAKLVTAPAHGQLDLKSDGSFSYTADTGFAGEDTFTYAVSDGIFDSDPGTVTLSVATPGSEPPQAPQNITVEANQGRPTITWDYDVNAQWFQIWIGNSNGTVHFEWYPAKASEAFLSNQAPISCNGVTCSVTPNINLLAGSYDVWMQSWGYGNFATGGPVSTAPSWNGPATFTLPSTPPGPVTGLTTTTTNGAVFMWQGAEHATWYNVWVGTDGTGTPAWTPQFFDWMLAEDLGCENAGVCTLTTGVATASGTANLNLPAGEYIWYVQSWGPGGFNTGGSFDPPLDSWVEADKFTVP